MIITQLPFVASDFSVAERIAQSLGYTQYAYTSGSSMVGLFCLRSCNGQRAGQVIKTKEFGFLFVQDLEDLNLA